MLTLGDNSKALEQYNEAISLFETMVLHEEALASERAGIFLSQQNEVDDAYELSNKLILLTKPGVLCRKPSNLSVFIY